jgi:transcriptional accessory protein Tex/SPT6
MAYTTAEARQELLDTVAEAANELGLASACLAEAYEQLDEASGDRLEEQCFRPVQIAYGRAKRAHTEFAGRHGLEAAAFEQQQPAGLPSQGAAAFIERAVEAVGAADRALAGLQDSMLPVEAGDQELRAALKSIREPIGDVPAKARQFLRGLGR